VRFGDPETQAILVRLESDLVEALEACVDGRLCDTELRWAPGASACVIASSQGYPGSYKTGLPITGLEAAAHTPGVQVFHSGTAQADGHLVTTGGRVLGVTAAGSTLDEALGRAYDAMAEIQFDGMYYRRDIGHRARAKKSVRKPVSTQIRPKALPRPSRTAQHQQRPVLSPRQIFPRLATWFAAFENTTGKALAGPG